MAHVILGLLLIAPQSLYGLIKSFEAGVALFYSASSGSIKRAIDGLLERGLIEVASVEPGGRGKKTYRTTDAGSAEFRTWMTGELSGSDLETAALSRLFFLGLLDEAERGPVLRRIRQRTAEHVARLAALEAQLDAVEVPAEFRDIFGYQRATLEYGLAAGRTAAAWFDDFAERVPSATQPAGAGSSEESTGAGSSAASTAI